MVFLEFYEALLGCAAVKDHKGAQLSEGNLSEEMSSQNALDAGTSLQVGSMGKTLHHMSAGGSSAKTTEMGKSRESDTTHTLEKTAQIQSPEDVGNCEVEPVSDTLVQSMAALDPKDPLHWGGSEGGELESWIQWTHHFFSKRFFPAHEHLLLLRREVEEERLRETARSRIALAKAKEAARLRELWEAEERRREEEEEEEAERAEGLDEDNLTPSALTTPMASATSVVPSKQSPSSAARKKKK